MLAEELSRYSQQLKLTDIGLTGQLKLKNARILCVGAGGLGSTLLLYLAAAGVGTVGIVDDDTVELSNLQRQILYHHAEVGHQKATSAARRLAALNPHVIVHTHTTRLHLANAEKLIAQYDIVADCSDNFATRYLINDVCFYLDKPFVFASIAQYAGQCSFFEKGDTGCFRCLFPSIPPEHTFLDCTAGGVLGVLPGLLGIIQANEIIKWILSIGATLAGRLLTLDTLTMDFRQFHLSKNPECKLCVLHHSVASLTQVQTCAELEHYAIGMQEMQSRLKEPSLLVDVRSPAEHNRYNLGGVLIPLPELLDRLDELAPEKCIIVYCQSGKRSMQAVKMLVERNFTTVKFLRGGIDALKI